MREQDCRQAAHGFLEDGEEECGCGGGGGVAHAYALEHGARGEETGYGGGEGL